MFKEGFEVLQAQLLEQLVALVLPEFKRFALPSIRSFHRGAWKVPEDKVTLRDLETRFGTYPVRLRKERWLDERAFRLAGFTLPRGMRDAQPGEGGIILGQELYLIASGSLAIIEPVGLWTGTAEKSLGNMLSVLTSAERVDSARVLEHFPLHEILPKLRDLLWYDRLPELAPPALDLEARRERFMHLVKELSQATAGFNERLGRALEPG